jgi:hypothetical protein
MTNLPLRMTILNLLIALLVSGCTGATLSDQLPTPSIETAPIESRKPAITITPTSPQMTVTQEGTVPGTSPSPRTQAENPLVRQAKEDLAQRLNIPIEDIDLLMVEQVVWRDSSLGCPQPGIMYAQVITPGFRVILDAAGKQYEYHTDTGRLVVLCEGENISDVLPLNTPTILSNEIITTPVSSNLERLIDTAKQDLARRLEITPDQIEVVLIEKAEWPDTSLGCAEPGLARRPVAIPGFRVTLSVSDREYVYHTGKERGVVYCPKG